MVRIELGRPWMFHFGHYRSQRESVGGFGASHGAAISEDYDSGCVPLGPNHGLNRIADKRSVVMDAI